jgi:hypothetical protein
MSTCLEMLLERKQDYNDFFNAIEYSVDKLYPDSTPVLGMGSGADSGTIAAALWSLGKPFDLVCVEGNENLDVLYDRLDFLDKNAIIIPPLSDMEIHSVYDMMEQIGFTKGKGTGIGTGLSHYVLASHVPNRHLYSGLGNDEFYTGDFQLFSRFMFRSNPSYSHFNVNTIFPLLEPEVFVEYYCLDPQLRVQYKQPFLEYMKSKNFPTDDTKKNFYVR